MSVGRNKPFHLGEDKLFWNPLMVSEVSLQTNFETGGEIDRLMNMGQSDRNITRSTLQ